MAVPLLAWLITISIVALPDVLLIQPDYNAAHEIDQSRMYPLTVFVAFIAWIVLLARLIQSEPVIGSTSFWLTRPIPRSVQLPSKTLFFVLFVFLLAFLPIAVHAIVFPPDWPSIGQQALTLAVVELMVAVTVIWVATYSPTLLHFAGMLCLGFVCTIVVFILSFQFHMRVMGEGLNFSLILPLIAVPGFLVSLVVQHTWRGSPWGLKVGLAGLALALLAQFFAPASSGPGGLSSIRTGKMTKVDFEPDWINTVNWQGSDYGLSRLVVATATLKPIRPDPNSIVLVGYADAVFQQPGKDRVHLRDNSYPDRFSSQPDPEIRTLLGAVLPGISIAGDQEPVKPDLTVPICTLTSAEADALRGQTGRLTIHVWGQVSQLDKMVAVPLGQPHAIGFVPGGFVRVKPVHPGDRQLEVWTIAPARAMNGLGNEFTYVLVDPQTRTAKILKTSGWSSVSVGLSTGVDSLQDGENYFPLDGTEPLNRMVLYVFDMAPHLSFQTTLTAPNFTMAPPPTPMP
ncbi:MAG TPA: hypothetical protein VHY09_09150 [Candidatus Methylacidiphilales bacterium]|nr:hypothetical protein [Candidatus Methylacidiphilales bacterium]